MGSARAYRDGVLERADVPLDDVAALVADPGLVLWVDLVADDDAPLRELAPVLGLDPLAVEDATLRHQRPKVDRYAEHLFVAVSAVQAADADAVPRSALRWLEIDAFVTPRALVTVRDPGYDPLPWVRRWEGAASLLKEGVGALLHGVLDVVVDGHIDAVLNLDERVDDLEDDLFDGTPGFDPARQRELHVLRRALVRVRLTLLPLREVLLDLSRAEDRVVTAALSPYFRDVYDHVIHGVDAAEGLRDMLAAIFETSLSLQDHQLNTVVRKLSAWAAIIGIPTAVTGWYGQNLPYPGFAKYWGFVMSASLNFALVVGLWYSFRRRGWI